MNSKGDPQNTYSSAALFTTILCWAYATLVQGFYSSQQTHCMPSLISMLCLGCLTTMFQFQKLYNINEMGIGL
jgi:hypothetical protein